MTSIRPRRSVLYMPGANARALEKAKGLAADALVLDLEDAVAPDKKQEARALIRAALEGGGYEKREVIIRTNGVDTAEFSDDIALVAATKPDGILVPKIETGEMIAQVRAALGAAQAPRPVWAMIETPLAILNLKDIAESARDPDGAMPLSCFVLGSNDLVKDTRAELDENRTAALYWLSATVTAARAYGIDVLDSVYNNFKDVDGYAAECMQGRQLGMDGKTLIHPSQIDLANATFGPSADEVAKAREIIAAFALPENQGKGVITIDGRMVELLHAEMAKRTVAIADAIAERV
ncbi:MAG: CoA ester lyase [Pseudomonadota bacterium]